MQLLCSSDTKSTELQVTFKLDGDSILTVEAHDLDSGRHHAWQKDDGAILAIKYEPPDVTAERPYDAITVPSGQAIAVC